MTQASLAKASGQPPAPKDLKRSTEQIKDAVKSEERQIELERELNLPG